MGSIEVNAKSKLTFLPKSYFEKWRKKGQQGNRGDMRKIHVTRQFFEASGRHGDLIEKTKNPFLDKVNGSMCAKFQVCIVVSVARKRDTNTQIHKYINTYTHIQVNLRISSAAARLTWILKK